VVGAFTVIGLQYGARRPGSTSVIGAASTLVGNCAIVAGATT